MDALIRALVKYERWDEVLRPGSIPWRSEDPKDKRRAFVEGLALVGTGRLDEARARLAILRGKEPGQGLTDAELRDPKSRNERILAAELLVAEGRSGEGLALLREQADEEKKRFASSIRAFGDPPSDPVVLCRRFADLCARAGDFAQAIPYYHATLNHIPNDGFSLAGLAVCYERAGNRERAEHYTGRLKYVWSNAPESAQLKAVAALGLDRARPVSETPSPERRYDPRKLDRLGPSNWQPFQAPNLGLRDVHGKPVTLSDYRGRNVILVFYLSEECVHCVDQLVGLNKLSEELSRENAVVLAVSSTSPERNRESAKLGRLAIQLLSDRNHEGARKCASYDDFEALELHSTILIDAQGRVRWKRTGGDPFMRLDLLMKELARVNAMSPGSARS
jgi:peroxiredoxin